MSVKIRNQLAVGFKPKLQGEGVVVQQELPTPKTQEPKPRDDAEE
jgi:hypothetical protein